MMDVGSMAAVMTSLSTAGTMLKAMLGIRDSRKVDAAVSDLNRIILEAQGAAIKAQHEQFQMVRRIGELEAELAASRRRQQDRDLYQLHDFGSQTLCYVLKEEVAKGTAFSHRLCVTCFDAGQRGTLQFDARTIMSQDIYRCGRCKTETKLGTPITPTEGACGSLREHPAATILTELEPCPHASRNPDHFRAGACAFDHLSRCDHLATSLLQPRDQARALPVAQPSGNRSLAPAALCGNRVLTGNRSALGDLGLHERQRLGLRQRFPLALERQLENGCRRFPPPSFRKP